MNNIIFITENNLENEIEKYNGISILDFYADWCGPCQMISPILEEIAKENPNIKIGKINVDKEASLAAGFQIVSIPTLIIIENGKIKNKVIGYTPKDEIMKLL